MPKKTVKIPNISCHHCVATIKREASSVEGVTNVDADVESKEAVFEWADPGNWDKILKAIVDAGYPPEHHHA